MSRRRANGEGTISPRKDGRYEVKAYVLTTSGSLERKSAYARSYDEARKKLTELLRQSGAMLETCGSAGKGCTFPVTE